ncbi:MAG TPA: hypothetical protein VHR66_29600 [Gemmataceae bacterium]|jgi:hypothetical protein|nr:hypothetical protein [Gemmataceae bacterium]
MSMNRWKVLACTLTIGVGGLAVFATDPLPTKEQPAKEPGSLPGLTVKPASPANGADTPAPVVPVKADEFELTVPAIPATPPKPDVDVKKPASEPVFEPVSPPEVPIILPAKGEADSKDKVKQDDKKIDPPVIVIPVPSKPETKEAPKLAVPPMPPLGRAVETPVPPIVTPNVPAVKNPEPVNLPEIPAKPIVPSNKVPPPPTPVPEVLRTPVPTPEVTKTPAATTKVIEQAKLKMLLRMGDGTPRFEIRNTATTELLLKVYGQKIEMQSPTDARGTLAGVSASGAVRFTAPGIEGTCDNLRIMSATGELLLEGQIRVKTKHGKTSTEMTADKMVFQISTSGVGSPSTPRTSVTPVGYIPD